MASVALVALQGEEETIMPGPDYELRPGCQILFAGTLQAQRMLDATLNNEYTLSYLMTGIDPPRGLALQWISASLGGAAPQAAG